MGLGDMYNIYIYICLRLSLDIYTCDYIDHDYYTHAVAFDSSMEFVLPVEIHSGSPQFSLGVSGSLRIRSPMVDKLHSRYLPPSSSNCQACSPFDTCASVLSRCPSQSSSKGQACSPFDTCAPVLELELSPPWILLLFNRVGVRAGVGGVQLI